MIASKSRAARQFPLLLEKLEDGSVTLTAVRLMAPILTVENHDSLIEAATHKPKRAVELLIATVRPKPHVETVVRKLPSKTAGATAVGRDQEATLLVLNEPPSLATLTDAVRLTPAHPPARPTIAPLSAERYKVQFTASRQLHDKLRRAQDLLRHTIPSGDPATIFERGLDLLLAQVERQKMGKVARPRASTRAGGRSRYIPAVVKREVWTRDQARCAFVGPAGRCTERGFLELHRLSTCRRRVERGRSKHRVAMSSAQRLRGSAQLSKRRATMRIGWRFAASSSAGGQLGLA